VHGIEYYIATALKVYTDVRYDINRNGALFLWYTTNFWHENYRYPLSKAEVKRKTTASTNTTYRVNWTVGVSCSKVVHFILFMEVFLVSPFSIPVSFLSSSYSTTANDKYTHLLFSECQYFHFMSLLHCSQRVCAWNLITMMYRKKGENRSRQWKTRFQIKNYRHSLWHAK